MNKPSRARPEDFPDTEILSLATAENEAAYAETEPAPLLHEPAAALAIPDGLSLAPVEVTLYEVMGLASKNNRVCPQPTRWLEFYRVLQDHAGGAALPAQPLVGSAWASTPPVAKRMSFQEQLEWADRNGCLQPAFDFLKALRDAEWYAT